MKKILLTSAALIASVTLAHAAAIPLYSPSFSNGVLDVTILNQTITAVNNMSGGGTPGTGTFNALTATTIGATTAGSGKFTTLQNTTSAGLTVAVSTDSTHTTATLCEDTTSHVVYFGSGAGGICAGTSSLRFKHDVEPLSAGLDQVLALQPISYKLNADHGDPNATLYGFSAEQGGSVLPQLMHRDLAGQPNSFDYLGVVPVLVRAVQEQQKEIEQLRAAR